MAAHQAPSSLGFSRQEHWSGLPFPPRMHESEKWKWSRLVMSDSSRPHGLQPTRLFRPWDSPGRSAGMGCHCLLHYCTTITSLTREHQARKAHIYPSLKILKGVICRAPNPIGWPVGFTIAIDLLRVGPAQRIQIWPKFTRGNLLSKL